MQSRGIVGERKSLKHLTETNTAIQYGLFGCINHEATRNSTYEATLKCDRSAMLTVPLPWPSPRSQQPTLQIRFTLNSAHQLTTALLVQNIVYVKEGFAPYRSACTLK